MGRRARGSCTCSALRPRGPAGVWHRPAWRDDCHGTGRRINDHAGRADRKPVTKPTWYPAWAAAEERERQDREDRADAERRDRQAEVIRQQAEEQRRQADEDHKLLESMPPQVWAGVEAARRAEASGRGVSSRCWRCGWALSCSASGTPRSWPRPASASRSPGRPPDGETAAGRRAGTR